MFCFVTVVSFCFEALFALTQAPSQIHPISRLQNVGMQTHIVCRNWLTWPAVKDVPMSQVVVQHFGHNDILFWFWGIVDARNGLYSKINPGWYLKTEVRPNGGLFVTFKQKGDVLQIKFNQLLVILRSMLDRGMLSDGSSGCKCQVCRAAIFISRHIFRGL